MTFYATELDLDPAFGWSGGPSTDVRIKALRNRHERRNRPSDLVQHTYLLPFQNVSDLSYLEYIKAAWMAMGGPHDTFLAKDYGDFTHGFGVTQAPMFFATADGGTEFQLSKRYQFGDAFYDRPITKPVATGLKIYVNDVLAAPDVDPLTGIVAFTTADAPDEGDVLTWEGQFRVPVRFDDFQLNSTIDNRRGQGRYAVNGSCRLVEVFGD